MLVDTRWTATYGTRNWKDRSFPSFFFFFAALPASGWVSAHTLKHNHFHISWLASPSPARFADAGWLDSWIFSPSTAGCATTRLSNPMYYLIRCTELHKRLRALPLSTPYYWSITVIRLRSLRAGYSHVTLLPGTGKSYGPFPLFFFFLFWPYSGYFQPIHSVLKSNGLL